MRILLLLVAACGGPMSPADLDHVWRTITADNRRVHDHAVARWHLEHPDAVPASLRVVTIEVESRHQPPALGTPLIARQLGLLDGEAIYADPATGELGFTSSACVKEGDFCACAVAPEYAYSHEPDGHVAIIRTRPVFHPRRVRVASCGFGCGIPRQPPPIAITELGITDLAHLHVYDLSYDADDLDVTCDRRVPVP